MPSTSCSSPNNERRRSHEVRGEDLRQSHPNHTGFRRSSSACVCLVDASGEITAVVWLQGRHEVRDRNGFSWGGSFTQKMHIAGAGEFSFTGRYDEIVEPERISYHADFGQAITRVVVEFFEQGNRTRVVLTHDGFPNEGFCKTVSEGTTESLDKLASMLADQALVKHL